jgi:RNA polymerase sigma factor (sigma-70 family)
MYSVNQADQQDLEQEICVQLWKAYPNFKGNSKASTWLYRVALNTAITFFKKQKRIEKENDACGEYYELITSDSDNELQEKLNAFYKEVEKLNKIEKALVMLYIDEKSYSEIAEILGISEVNARVKLNRVKSKLKKQMQQ